MDPTVAQNKRSYTVTEETLELLKKPAKGKDTLELLKSGTKTGVAGMKQMIERSVLRAMENIVKVRRRWRKIESATSRVAWPDRLRVRFQRSSPERMVEDCAASVEEQLEGWVNCLFRVFLGRCYCCCPRCACVFVLPRPVRVHS